MIHDDDSIETQFYSREKKPIFDADLWTTRVPKGITIIPNQHSRWTIQLISTLLNVEMLLI
jgi:hypothetical protein